MERMYNLKKCYFKEFFADTGSEERNNKFIESLKNKIKNNPNYKAAIGEPCFTIRRATEIIYVECEFNIDECDYIKYEY